MQVSIEVMNIKGRFDNFKDLGAGKRYMPLGEVIDDSNTNAPRGMTNAELRGFNADKNA
jgi:hypothetical protein